MKRNNIKLLSSRLRQKRRVIFIIRIFIVSAIVLGFFGGLRWFFNYPPLVINTIFVSGADTSDEKDIRSLVETELRGRYLGLFSKAHFILYPRRRLERAIYLSFPKFQSVELTRSGFSALSVFVRERETRGIWCSEIKDNLENSSCFLIDREGLIFDSLPKLSEDKKNFLVKFFGAISAPLTPIGQHYLSPEYFVKLIKFLGLLPKVGITPQELFRLGDGDMRISTLEGPIIFFKDSDELTIVFENLGAFLSADLDRKDEKIVPMANDFEYIDLRFGNKIFYKPRK